MNYSDRVPFPARDMKPVSRERITPQSLESEQATLGACLMERHAIAKAQTVLHESDFYRELNKKIWACLLALLSRNEPVDLITVSEELRRRGQLEEVGGAAYLTALIEHCPSAENVDSYARVVKEMSVKRHLLKASEQIQGLIYSESVEFEDLQSTAERLIRESGTVKGSHRFQRYSEIVAAECESLLQASTEGRRERGVKTGFLDLDDLLSGLQKTDLIIVAARPSIGKTALCMQAAGQIAQIEQRDVLIDSLEMGKSQLILRDLSRDSRINGRKLQNVTLDNDDWRKLGESAVRMKGYPIWVNDTPNSTVYELKAHARRHQAEHGDPAAVFIDHLQLIKPATREGNRTNQVGEIVHELKALARELNCPVVLLCQLSRKVEEREDKRPMLSDLRESGDIEQDADVVIFIYRESYYKARKQQWGPVDEDVAEIIVAKHRNGPTGTITLGWEPEYTRFENLERSY